MVPGRGVPFVKTKLVKGMSSMMSNSMTIDAKLNSGGPVPQLIFL